MGLFSGVGKKLIGDPTEGYSGARRAQKAYYEKARGDLEPYRALGQPYIDRINSFFSTNDRPTPESVKSDPGYQFRLNEGINAVQNSAAARGGLKSGNAMRALMDYAQNYASSEYGNAVDRYESGRQNEFARLFAMLEAARSAAGGTSSLATNLGNQIANLRVGESEADFRTGMAQHQVNKDINDSIAKWFGG